MALEPAIKKVWIELQKTSDQPINAIGIRIDPKDRATMEVWKSEGIDQYVKR